MSTVVFLAILCSFLGIKETNPIISSLLFLAAPLTTIMFGAYFFKEKLSFVNVIFIIIILCGSFILQYQTV
jgi:drug/metabolite transporter (DMT)-like permease